MGVRTKKESKREKTRKKGQMQEGGWRKEKDIRWKELECCLCWLPDSIAVPWLCVGCALNPRQLINPALLHSPQALSIVSAMLHNDPALGWEVQSRPVSRATLALGTRPPYTPLKLCLELNMPHRDENSALSTLLPGLLHSRLFIWDCQRLQTWLHHLTML